MTRERPDQFPEPEEPAVPSAAGLSQTAAAASPADLAHRLRAQARQLGFARVGIAGVASPPRHAAFVSWLQAGLAGPMTAWLARHEPLRADPQMLLPAARSIVMLATDYDTSPRTPSRHRAVAADGNEVTAAPPGHGRVARYAVGDDYHDLLRSRLNMLADWLSEQVPGSASRGVVDSAPLAERDFGWLAGLGWFGKNTMLIDPRAGSYFLLSALLTDIPLPAYVPIETYHCGTCTACLDACPTGALPQPRLLDATKCISALTIEDHGPIAPALRAGMGDWIFGCDICQEVCPWNRYATGSADPVFQPRGGEDPLDLAGLLALDEAGFRDRFRGSPILRAKRRGLLRSAAIVLGNRPHPPAFEALAVAAADDDAIIRGAAAWALGRWITAGVMPAEARQAVRVRLGSERDASVRVEL